MTRKLTALVIGNAGYPDGAELRNPAHDAEDVGAEFGACGFTVDAVLDSNLKKMEKVLKGFKKSLKDSDVGLFFFAGHGMQIDGDNYLNAIDTNFDDELEAKHSSLALNKVIELMERSGTSTNVIILDACRNNPFERAWHRSSGVRGLAPVYAPKGTLIAYATSPGQFAADGRGRNGAYTQALLQHIRTPDCSIENMFKRVRNTLSAATKQKQISWEHTSLSGEFYFNLSLGMRIDQYSPTALSDSLFVLDEGRASHRMIQALKSHTWPTQNPAIDEFTVAQASRLRLDTLFVIGRNIYQAACGNSHSAIAYLKNFIARTKGLAGEKRKALLDGMLFEVFFDSKAGLRENFKNRMLSELFFLQQYDDLSESFDFIAECLLPDAARFYSIPGKNHPVVVDVTTEQRSSNEHTIEAIYSGGSSILVLEHDSFTEDPGEPARYEKMGITAFESKLSEDMLVPIHLLKINYASFKKQGGERIRFPIGYTVRKQ